MHLLLVNDGLDISTESLNAAAPSIPTIIFNSKHKDGIYSYSFLYTYFTDLYVVYTLLIQIYFMFQLIFNLSVRPSILCVCVSVCTYIRVYECTHTLSSTQTACVVWSFILKDFIGCFSEPIFTDNSIFKPCSLSLFLQLIVLLLIYYS